MVKKILVSMIFAGTSFLSLGTTYTITENDGDYVIKKKYIVEDGKRSVIIIKSPDQIEGNVDRVETERVKRKTPDQIAEEYGFKSTKGGPWFGSQKGMEDYAKATRMNTGSTAKTWVQIMIVMGLATGVWIWFKRKMNE